MRNIFCFLAALIFCVNAFCSSADSTVKINDSAVKTLKTVKPVKTKVYNVNYWVSGSIIVVGMVGDFFAISRIKSKKPITTEELNFANTDQQINLMNSIDRWALKQNTSNRDLYTKLSDYGQVVIFLLPSLLIIDKNIRKDWLHLLFMYVEGHTITFTFYNYSFLGPTFQNRFRPVTYYSEFSYDIRTNTNNRNSFYSGHVASCAYSTFFMAKVYCDYHPNMGAGKYLLYLAAAVPPALMGYFRVGALAHFPSDDAVGFALGAVLGIAIPALHKYPCHKYLSLGMVTSPDVVGLSISWNLTKQHSLIATK